MFKNTNSRKITGILLALVLVTACFIGGSIARYVTSTSSEDDARVAKWGFSETPEPVTMNLFKNEYKLDGNTVVAKSNDDADIIAPGLNGVSKFKFVTSSVSPEVMYEVKISLDDSEVADEIKNHPGIQWKVDNGNWGTWDEMVASLVSLSGDPSGMKVYAPGELHNNFKNTTDHTIAWQWVMDSGYDIEDTVMGNLAASGTPITAKIVVTVLAQQTDIDSTGMLEGNGSVFNINDPQVLTFRADADYSTFDSVEIDDVEINDSNYTDEPGSIKIILNKDYLASLSLGNHKITINTTDGKAIESKFIITDSMTIIHNNIIPEGGTYYKNVTSTTLGDYTDATIYESGYNFPTTNNGDIYVYGDYEYRYNMSYNASKWTLDTSLNGWGVGVFNREKTTYGNILTTINNKNIVSLKYLFVANTNLISSPIIPTTVVNMESTFAFCNNLTTTPTLPIKLENLTTTFESCSGLTIPPTIPNNVKKMTGAFVNCTNLTGTIEINANNLESFDNCFYGTKITNITGSISDELKLSIAKTSNIVFLHDGKDTTKTGVYYTGVLADETQVYGGTTNKYINGAFPETVNNGDVYVYGDYEYRYNMYYDANLNRWMQLEFNGWSVTPLDKTKENYGELLSNINGKDLTYLDQSFQNCTNLKVAPEIPNTVTDMFATFMNCQSLETASIIPSNVSDLTATFYGCANLTGTIEINAEPSSYDDTFTGTTKSITLTGSSSKVNGIASYYTNVTVTQ